MKTSQISRISGRFSYTLGQAVHASPYELWCKVAHKISRRLRYIGGHWQARFMKVALTDIAFERAIKKEFVDIQACKSYLARRNLPSFFLDLRSSSALIDAFHVSYAEYEGLIIEVANQVCEHKFDLLGAGVTDLGDKIDWHVDFKTGHRYTPDKFYLDFHPAAYPGGHDIKVPWELSRCQHFVWLGQAYWFTGDETYAREFVGQVLDWIAQNPPQLGVNWASTMDVAIRVVNWLWGYYFFHTSPALHDAAFLLPFFKSLLIHGRHIRRNLERSALFTGNHYLSNIVALVYLGYLLPEFKEAERWRTFGLRELEREMFKQVYADGVNFEASVSYHRLVLEMSLSATILAQLHGHTFSSQYLARLEKMVEFILYATEPDGTVPLIGDNDNGRLHRLKVWKDRAREWADYRYLLAIGAVLFEREDFAIAAGQQWEEALWIWGERAIAFRNKIMGNEHAPLKLASRGFRVAGLYVMRHQDVYMLVDAGSNGQNGEGGHAHNDALSFEVNVGGQKLLVDPGVYVYTADYEMRNIFRSTAYHNTVSVDGEEQNRLYAWNLFRLGDEANPQVNQWETTAEFDLFDAEHTGYRRLSAPIQHRRQIFFNKEQPVYWLIRDHLTGEGEHTFECFFHVGEATLHFLTPLVVELVGQADARLAVVPLQTTGLTVTVEDTYQAPGYGKKVAREALRYCQVGEAPAEFLTVLWPLQRPAAWDELQDVVQTSTQVVVERLRRRARG